MLQLDGRSGITVLMLPVASISCKLPEDREFYKKNLDILELGINFKWLKNVPRTDIAEETVVISEQASHT